MQSVVSPSKPSDGGRPNDALTIQAARLGLEMFGLGGVASGTVKPYGTVKVLVQAGYVSASTNGSGVYAVTFPQAFPTACICVVSGGNATSPVSAICVNSVTKTGFTFSLNSGGASKAFTSGWIALGY